MAAGHVFLTQVSSRAWKCSECPLVFIAEEAGEVNRMLNRFVHHVRKSHQGISPSTGARTWKPRRRRRSAPEEPEPRPSPET